MNKKKQILINHFKEDLGNGILQDDYLDKLVSKIELEEGESNEEDEVRSITLEEDTDGTISAKSIKLYNLMNVSIYDLMGFLLKETTILLTQDVKVKAIMSLFNLIFEFYPKLTYKFNKTDAKILMAIYLQKREPFSIPELQESYQSEFDKVLSIQQLNRSLPFFENLEVIKKIKGTDQYKAKERITYERK